MVTTGFGASRLMGALEAAPFTCSGTADFSFPSLWFCRRSSGDAPVPAHSLPEAACLSGGRAAAAVHRLLRRPISGAAVASQRPRCDHAGGVGRARGEEPAP